MRRALPIVVALAVAACDPEIGSGTYFCGPEMFCPPDLACNANTFTCEIPGTFDPFSCPEGSQADEPDDSVSDAGELGQLECNYTGSPLTRCIADFDDEDYTSFEIDECLVGDPHVEVELRFPVAMAPLVLDVVDENDAVIASGEPCTPEQHYTGMDWLCAEIPGEAGRYFVRVRASGDADCDGQCQFNQYLLYVSYPIT